MIEAFSNLSDTDVQALISGLRSGRITDPFSELQIMRIISDENGTKIAEGLKSLESLNFNPAQIATALELVLHDRRVRESTDSLIDLVTSGPEAPGITNRDTSIVVREMFAHAKQSVLVVGYAVYQGQQVFQSLARRMEEIPDLDVKFFLNISRPDRDQTTSEILVSRFKQRFTDSQWPAGCRLPEVYYDPRSIADSEQVRSSLHAKCIVTDSEQVFVSSANFTEAGQERNIEIGLSIRNQWLSQRIIRHFLQLRDNELAIRAF